MRTDETLPRIGITAGDPAGIGPEIAIKAARDPRVVAACRPVIYGPWRPEALAGFATGVISADAGRAAYDAIVEATNDALGKRVDAIATGPINKAAFAAAGLPWKGHTDLLGHLCGVDDVAMMFWSERLRVVLATVHIPLAEVPSALTARRLLDVVRLTSASLPRFGIRAPRLAVAGLNPHAGEGGL
ncbi:MAG TPA: 4-hydroxythreonine-4-phosphate dehydrogenase PdxA, partial [Vicinamibacterales bacterium]|nr:4-hydroxythreonine-4-phosphate dehydrogenase PdxA [Vicinamibacterales bacterium]